MSTDNNKKKKKERETEEVFRISESWNRYEPRPALSISHRSPELSREHT